MPTFTQLGLDPLIVRTVEAEGYATPTPIQEQAIPAALNGQDILGLARTGTGKTAAFALPILQQLSRNPPAFEKGMVRALILSPTRELAAQIGERLQAYSRCLPITHTVIFGGVSQKRQAEALEEGIDILVATPGRFMDLYQQKKMKMDKVQHLVLDEADRMLDMGFIVDVRRILELLPRERQTMFFSATMPAPIQRLADMMLRNPLIVNVSPPNSTAENVEQEVLFVSRYHKRKLLKSLLIREGYDRVLVFTETKAKADTVYKHLCDDGVNAEVIHGDKEQSRREKALEAFRDGTAPVLIATDVAARGIDIDGISHVINYEVPRYAEVYVHRVGRTARAGASGNALTFCDASELAYWRAIEKLIGSSVRVATELAEHVGIEQWSDGAKAARGSAEPVRARRGRRPSMFDRPDTAA